MLNHIGITIREAREIRDFYQDILGFKIVRSFKITKDLVKKIFDIGREADVFLLQKNDFFLEIFIDKEKIINNFSHICVNLENRDDIIKMAKNGDYKCRIIPRQEFDLVFIEDKNGNIFELKEIS